METVVPIDGRRRWRGRLRGLEGENVRLELEDGSEIALPFSAIVKARLLLTDDLLAAQAGR
jgi:ribosome maturation factor RimP